MDKAHYILLAALVLCLYFLFKPTEPANTFEQELKAARDSLNTSLAVQDSIVAISKRRQDSLTQANRLLSEKEVKFKAMHHENRRIITTANDSQLVRIISIQHPPAGY